MKVTDQDVAYVADLANLELSDQERVGFLPCCHDRRVGSRGVTRLGRTDHLPGWSHPC